MRNFALIMLIFCSSRAFALDYVKIKRSGQQFEVAGKIEVEAVDGGVLLLARDGELWPIVAEELVSKRKDAIEFKPFTEAEMNKQLLAKHPGFKLHQTKHYTICYNTSKEYAQWVGSLYERLYDGFYNFWSTKKIKLEEPVLPLVALVFDSRKSFELYAEQELNGSVGRIIGYYSLQTNQVTMYDLTGLEGLGVKKTGSAAARINAILSQPAAERNVATIVHEATHQLAYNSGLQTRYADIPFWVSEGLAMYFETPDLESAKGWKRIGGVNQHNLVEFHKWLRERPANSLAILFTEDKRFREGKTVSAAYAEAWALNYFLLNKRNEKYCNYLKELSVLKPLESSQRLDIFKQSFGEDLEELEKEFLKFMLKVE